MNPIQVAACVQVATTALQLGLYAYDHLNADPVARINALNKLNEETKEAIQKSKDELKKNQQEFEDSSRRREEAAIKKHRVQKEENEKKIKELEAVIHRQNEFHDRELRKIDDEHSENIQNLRRETKEIKDKSERLHKEKIQKLEQKFEKENILIEKKLEAIKIERAQKMEAAEKEKGDLKRERVMKLKAHLDAMQKLEELYQEQLREIEERNTELKVENAQEKEKQYTLENKTVLDELDKQHKAMISSIQEQNVRDVIKNFKKIQERFNNVRDLLEKIHVRCHPPPGIPLQIQPGELDACLAELSQQIGYFKLDVAHFHEYMINITHQGSTNFKPLTKYISHIQMEAAMASSDITKIEYHLPNAIEKQNIKGIESMGAVVNKLQSEFNDVKLIIDKGTTKVLNNFLSGQEERKRITN